ncbi:hypothetical protein J6500_13775 [Bradyrhizobium sp. WSM 1704]|uniref:hypothetical protein n=1 Tax=Bradyrhizobium semiaridum TaxID=2821404 RepID=UPI001CE2A021|nr:hypothetical protein [Bradyrhizobium semiaridum]MCA6122958.1 hypothetical protein [Bradyrhizobium semiaridum]
MKLNAAMLMTALVLSGTVLAQSSGPSAGGAAEAGQGGGQVANQGANVTTTGQALNSNKKTGDSGPPIDKAQRAGKPDTDNMVGASRPKPDRRNEHYP